MQRWRERRALHLVDVVERWLRALRALWSLCLAFNELCIPDHNVLRSSADRLLVASAVLPLDTGEAPVARPVLIARVSLLTKRKGIGAANKKK